MARVWIIRGFSEAVDAQRFEQAFPARLKPGALTNVCVAGLAYYRNIPGGRRLGAVAANERQSLRRAMFDADVPLLRQRLAMTGGLGYKNAKPAVSSSKNRLRFFLKYDETMVKAVRLFSATPLAGGGRYRGQQTRTRLMCLLTERIDQIRANLERRLRWLLHGKPARFILVEYCGYSISYFSPKR